MALTNFGNQNKGSVAVQFPPANNKAVCRFQNNTGNDVTIKKVWALWGTATATGRLFKAVIYSDSIGTPSSLLAVSQERDGHGGGWVDFELVTPIVVPAGGYVWIGMHSNVMDICSYCLNSGQILYNTDAYSDGPSATFGAASTAPYTYPIAVEGDDGQMRFGRSSVDAGSGNYQPDREHGEKFVLGGTESVSVTSISTYVKTTSATVKSKAAIFNDGGGLPTTKVAQTQEVTGSTANSWLTLPFDTSPTLTPGTYWLCFISSQNIQTPTVPFGGALRADGSDTEAIAFSSPSTLADSIAPLGIDIYATYAVVPLGETPIAGEIPASIAGAAALSLGTAISGAIPASVTGIANLDNGATLIAAGRIEATPRARLAGAAAPVSNSGNFFLLF